MKIQDLIDAQKHIIIICDDNFNLKYVNKIFFDYFKQERLNEMVEFLKTKPLNIDFKEKFVNYKNHKFDFEIKIEKIDDEFIITMYDITKYTAYKKSLLSSNISFFEYKNLVDQILIVSKTDLQGNITYVNQHFINISGYTQEELIGKPHNIIRHSDMPSYIFKNMWKTISSGKIWQGVIKNRKKNGELYYVKTMIAPLFNENNQIKEYIAFRADITELIRAKEKAQSAKRTKEMFLANMSHEIRTPLTAIIGFIDVLKKKEISNDIKEIVDTIDNSAETLLNIVNDILDISKIESEGVILTFDKFNPNKSFENSVKLFEAKAKVKNIEYIYNIDVPNCIISDEHRLKQVLSNLIGNAIKFTSENGKVIVNILSFSEDSKDNKKINISFSIKDTGIGVPKDQINKLFKPFSQIENNKNFGGTGLGLYISNQIINKLGGKIKIKSEENQGSEFFFTLEFDKCDKIENKLDEDINVKGKILIAEDNNVNQKFLKIFFKTKGDLEIDIVNNGLEALEKYKKNKYDIVFMDIFMPVMRGEEATQAILEYEKQNNLSHTPIIALTANALRGDKEKFLSQGFDDYISKPIDNKKLDKILQKYLNNSDNIINNISENLDLDKEIIKQLLDMYFENINVDLNKLKTAIKNKDFKEIWNIAHRIVGGSSAVALHNVYNIAKEIEINARDKKDINYQELFDKLVSEIQKYKF